MRETKQTIKFKAVKVVKEPTKISFVTKNGQKVTFTAVKAVERPVKVEFNTRHRK